jgi:hypothetical protein
MQEGEHSDYFSDLVIRAISGSSIIILSQVLLGNFFAADTLVGMI